jgi:hypothetical protein
MAGDAREWTARRSAAGRRAKIKSDGFGSTAIAEVLSIGRASVYLLFIGLSAILEVNHDRRRGHTGLLPAAESFALSRAPLDGGLATGAGRSAHLHGLLPPILSAHRHHLTHLLWYCYFDLSLLSGFFLSGYIHRCSARDNRYRGQSDHHFA